MTYQKLFYIWTVSLMFAIIGFVGMGAFAPSDSRHVQSTVGTLTKVSGAKPGEMWSQPGDVVCGEDSCSYDAEVRTELDGTLTVHVSREVEVGVPVKVEWLDDDVSTAYLPSMNRNEEMDTKMWAWVMTAAGSLGVIVCPIVMLTLRPRDSG